MTTTTTYWLSAELFDTSFPLHLAGEDCSSFCDGSFVMVRQRTAPQIRELLSALMRCMPTNGGIMIGYLSRNLDIISGTPAQLLAKFNRESDPMRALEFEMSSVKM